MVLSAQSWFSVKRSPAGRKKIAQRFIAGLELTQFSKFNQWPSISRSLRLCFLVPLRLMGPDMNATTQGRKGATGGDVQDR
jgi:hypothetical protein